MKIQKARFCGAILCLLMLGTLLLSSCGKNDRTVKTFENLSDFQGSTMAAITGTAYDAKVHNNIEDVTFKYYDDHSACVQAIKKGDVVADVLSYYQAMDILSQQPDLTIFPQAIEDIDYGYMIKKGSDLTERISAVIRELRLDGTTDALEKKWLDGDSSTRILDYSLYNLDDRGNGVLTCYCDPTKAPMCYVADGKTLYGYEVELLLMVADRLNMGVKFVVSNFGALTIAVTEGKADLAFSGISVTEERLQSVDFTEYSNRGHVVLLCKKAWSQGMTPRLTPHRRMTQAFLQAWQRALKKHLSVRHAGS